jgi:hypothetical protein
MGRFEQACSSLPLAGDAVHALFRGEESEDAELGAMILAAGALVWFAPAKKG